ncbi:hypothetical protein ACFC0M_21870 [Streptomyces sp. NPDC056149]|uniref:hypothetical protein n=1 Tax=Streptomyces sp. NPDC056149 TaxID=3345728 RepID=UPI0035DA3578
MKPLIRTGVVAALAAGALAAAVLPAAAAASAESARPATGAHRALANPQRVSAAAYNQARSILAQAGSQTAAKSHPVHGKKDVPVSHGTSLLAAARDEFRQADRHLPPKDKRSDMSIPHYNAIHNAARAMGIDRW